MEPKEEMAALCWQYPQASLTGVLPQWQPFREKTLREETLLFLPDEDGDGLELYQENKNPENSHNPYILVEREKKQSGRN